MTDFEAELLKAIEGIQTDFHQLVKLISLRECYENNPYPGCAEATDFNGDYFKYLRSLVCEIRHRKEQGLDAQTDHD